MGHVLQCSGHNLLIKNIISANNCTLIDDAGNSYLDLESGIWCTAVGHGNPEVLKTLQNQANSIMHAGYCYSNAIVEKTAEKILEITGHTGGKCLFLSSGSEAVDLSITIAKILAPGKKLLTMEDSYLSAFGNFTRNHAHEWIKYNWITKEDPLCLPWENISACIFEPGSSSGLVRFPPIAVIQELTCQLKKNGGLLIANEVTTGIGRTGEWFGYTHYGIQPDIVAMGKGLGNGYPVSCISLSQEVAAALAETDFHYSQSHQNDPLGCAVALQVLTILERDKLIKKAQEKGAFLQEKLLRLQNKYGIIREVRGRGLMLAIEFKPHTQSLAEIINKKLLEKHIILVRRPHLEVFRLDPALTISYEELERFINTLEHIFQEITEE